jgi:uncharacterized DUF497 family protein
MGPRVSSESAPGCRRNAPPSQPGIRILFVVYVEVEASDVFRIISARKATPHERKAYESE